MARYSIDTEDGGTYVLTRKGDLAGHLVRFKFRRRRPYVDPDASVLWRVLFMNAHGSYTLRGECCTSCGRAFSLTSIEMDDLVIAQEDGEEAQARTLAQACLIQEGG